MPRIYWPLFWDENNERHLLESHNVTKQEVEELIFDQDATQKRKNAEYIEAVTPMKYSAKPLGGDF